MKWALTSLPTQTLLWFCDFSLRGLVGSQRSSGCSHSWYVGVGNTQKNNDVWNLHWKLRYRILSYEILLYSKNCEFLLDPRALSWLTGTRQRCQAVLLRAGSESTCFTTHGKWNRSSICSAFLSSQMAQTFFHQRQTQMCVWTQPCACYTDTCRQTQTNLCFYGPRCFAWELITWFLAG